MPDKIHLMLESILQESRAAKQVFSDIQKEMITHEVFMKHNESMSDRLKELSDEQQRQSHNIKSINNKLGIDFKDYVSSNSKKIGGTLFIIITIVLGNVLVHSYVANIMHLTK